MDEEKTFSGTLVSYEVRKTGLKKDGTPWTQYRYSVDEWSFWGFFEPKDLLNKKVKVTYVEADNPRGEAPIKQIRKMEAELPKEPGVQSVIATPLKTGPTSPDSFFGMIFNQAMEQMRYNDKSSGSVGDFREEFDRQFELLWSLATEARKKKLGY